MKTTSIITNGFLLFLFLFGLIACLAGCQTVNGKKHYIGPKIRGAITYRGIGLELTLFDPYNPTDTRTIDVTPDTPTGGKQPINP